MQSFATPSTRITLLPAVLLAGLAERICKDLAGHEHGSLRIAVWYMP